jgi:hypothetical protein
VLYPESHPRFNFFIEQFWGRAARVSWTRKSLGMPVIFLVACFYLRLVALESRGLGGYQIKHARARSMSKSRSRALRVSAAARSNSVRASSKRPSFLSRSPRTLGSR